MDEAMIDQPQFTQETSNYSKTCLLFRLPNELIDQVVLRLQHPADLLALARTCKFMCRVLTDSTASFMWARTRRQSIPIPIPDPLNGYTESGWAAFLFGPNKCVVCHKTTFALPYSFAMAIHTCYKCRHSSRREIFTSGTLVSSSEIGTQLRQLALQINEWHGDAVEKIITVALTRVDDRFGHGRYGFYHFDSDYEATEFTRFVRDLTEAKAQGAKRIGEVLNNIKRTWDAAKKKRVAIDAISKWASAYEKKVKEVENEMYPSAVAWANSLNLDYQSMKNSSDFRKMRRNMRRMDTSDFGSYPIKEEDLETITSQTNVIHDRRMNLHAVRAMESRRRSIDIYYQRNITKKDLYPNLNTFRGFPCIISAQRNEDDNFFGSLHSATMTELIQSDLTKWVERAKNLARVTLLGYVDSFKASKPKRLGRISGDGRKEGKSKTWRPLPDKLDPEMRVSSFFMCKICKKLENIYERMGAMDFKGLCRHKCLLKERPSKDQPKWKISNFALATRCKDAMQSMLWHLDIDESNLSITFKSLGQNDKFSYGWVCNHCPASLGIMEYEDMIRHAQRHEIQNISHVSWGKPMNTSPDTAAAATASTPATSGNGAGVKSSRVYRTVSNPISFAELLLKKNQGEAKRRQFACNHCHISDLSESNPTSTSSSILTVISDPNSASNSTPASPSIVFSSSLLVATSDNPASSSVSNGPGNVEGSKGKSQNGNKGIKSIKSTKDTQTLKSIKALDFNGMRSHLKEKHGISDVRNCDFRFVEEAPPKAKAVGATETNGGNGRGGTEDVLLMHPRRPQAEKRYHCWICNSEISSTNQRRFDASGLKAHMHSKHPESKFEFTSEQFQAQEREIEAGAEVQK